MSHQILGNQLDQVLFNATSYNDKVKVFNTDLLEMLACEGLLPNVLWKNLIIITYIISPMTRCHHRVTRNDPVPLANNYIMMRQWRKLYHIRSSSKEFIASQAFS